MPTGAGSDRLSAVPPTEEAEEDTITPKHAVGRPEAVMKAYGARRGILQKTGGSFKLKACGSRQHVMLVSNTLNVLVNTGKFEFAVS
jgi:hypothetical protein